MEATKGTMQGPKRMFKLKLIHRYFDDIAEDFPNDIAVICEDEVERKITFRELFESSNKLARAILNLFSEYSLRANREDYYIICLKMKPSISAVITMLAILKCGAAYFPINQFYTKFRFREVLGEVQPQLVITDNETRIDKFLCMTFEKLASLAEDLSPLYLIDDYSFTLGQNTEALTIYTSGTLGNPKGTILTHSHAQNRLEWQWMKFPFSDDEKFCISRMHLCHIDHFGEICGALGKGRTLVIVDEKFHKDETKIIEILEKYNIKRLTGLPSFINSIVSNLPTEGKRLQHVRLWISTGEPLTKSMAEKFFDYFTGNQMLVNFYGCTETTGECASFTIESRDHLNQLIGDEIPIGCPTMNTIIYVMDKKLSPTSKVGEIFVSGKIVSQCYVQEDAENRTILNNHLSISPAYWKMFRTMDYGVIRDGLLYFCGRTGRTIRIENQLIDLSAIESFLNSLQYISKSAVAIKDHKRDELIAFVCLKRGFAYITEKIVREKLAENLPNFVTPAVIILDDLPLTMKGNVDYDGLISRFEDNPTHRRRSRLNFDIDVRDFFGEEEQMKAKHIFQIVGESIGNVGEAIKSESNFYDLGGNSLNLLLAVANLNDSKFYISTFDFMRSNSMREIFEKCTISENSVSLALDSPENMKIQQIGTDDTEECANLLARCYVEKNNLIKFISDLKSENIYQFLKANWRFFVDKELSFKVLGKDDEILAVSLNYERHDEHQLEKKDIKAMEPIQDFFAFVESDFIKTQYPNERILTPYMMGTSTLLDAEENIRVVFMMEDHLIKIAKQKKFKAIVAIETCPLNAQIHKSIHGYETVKEFSANQFVDKNGHFPFDGAANSLKASVQIYENIRKKS